ncbi:hypothetical protein ACLMJK_002479 [Lecanora helva]
MADPASIALGVFPIVIEGLRMYEKSFETFKRFYAYRETAQSYVWDFLTAERIFKNTLTRLLNDCVESTDIDIMLADPGGSLWRDATYQESLKTRLGPSFAFFSHAVGDMVATMSKIRDKLCLDAENQVAWLNDKSHKRHWKKAQLSLRDKAIKQLLEMMVKHNEDIRELVGHSQHLDIMRFPKTSVKAKKYEVIRNQARSLYNMLKHKFSWPCGCKCVHSASLRLEHRNGNRVASTDPKQELNFNILFSFEAAQNISPIEPPWDWREAKIEPLNQTIFGKSPQAKSAASLMTTASANADASTTFAATGFSLTAIGGRGGLESFRNQNELSAENSASPKKSEPRPKKVSFASPVLADTDSTQVLTPSEKLQHGVDSLSQPKTIEGLCQALLDVREATCLGELVDERARHRLSIIDASSGKDPVEIVSLQDLFAHNPLARKDRLILGVKLASTLLQLHNTPWLPKVWGKVDIRFKVQRTGLEASRLHQPFLSQHFQPPTCHVSSSSNNVPSALQRAQSSSILALGIILIELWFWKPIQDLRSPDDLDSDNRPNMHTDFTATSRLLKHICVDAGHLYYQAVKHCIYNEYDDEDNSLNVQSIKEAVHNEIVSPLERNLTNFCGESLQGLT